MDSRGMYSRRLSRTEIRGFLSLNARKSHCLLKSAGHVLGGRGNVQISSISVSVFLTMHCSVIAYMLYFEHAVES